MKFNFLEIFLDLFCVVVVVFREFRLVREFFLFCCVS